MDTMLTDARYSSKTVDYLSVLLETKQYNVDAKVTLLGDATNDVKKTLLTKIKSDNNPKATMG